MKTFYSNFVKFGCSDLSKSILTQVKSLRFTDLKCLTSTLDFGLDLKVDLTWFYLLKLLNILNYLIDESNLNYKI